MQTQLSELTKGHTAIIHTIKANNSNGKDLIAQRLQELGFVSGEFVKITAYAPGRDPLLVEIAGTQFALRRSEAARILVCASDEVTNDVL